MEQLYKSKKKNLELGKLWRIEEIFEVVEEVNPEGYYPEPLDEKKLTGNSTVKANLVPKTGSYLTKEKLKELYRQCNKLVHAHNPLDQDGETNYQEYWDKVPYWKHNIIELLNTHKINLVGHDGFCLVHMEERDGKVHLYEFEKVK